MKKIAFILSCIMIMALIPAIGVSADEYPLTPISTADEFMAISDVPGNYYLTGDIDFAGMVFDKCILQKLDGTLDGDGHKLYNFSIDFAGGSDSALVLKVGSKEDTTIKNLTLGSADTPIVTSQTNTGYSCAPFIAVTGNNDPGTNVVIENVNLYLDAEFVFPDAANKGNTAGFVSYGCKKGTLTFNNCTLNGELSVKAEVEGNAWRMMAGFVANGNTPSMTFNNCVNNADVTQGNTFVEARAAGFIAYIPASATATINSCTNNGNITVLGDTAEAWAAGFISDVVGVAVLDKCINNGTVKGCWYSAGFVAYHRGKSVTLTDCTNAGEIAEGGVAVSASCGFVLPELELIITNFTNNSSSADAVTTAPETTETPAPDTEPPADTGNATEAPDNGKTEAPDNGDTEAPGGDATEAPGDETEAAKSGCGGMISGVVAVVAILGTALIIKKRD